MDSNLVEYIKRQRKKGYSKDQIKNVLLKAGYNEKDIKHAISLTDRPVFIFTVLVLIIILIFIISLDNQPMKPIEYDKVAKEYNNKCWKLKECQKTLDMADQLIENGGLFYGYLYKGFAYFELGEQKKALDFFDKAEDFASDTYQKRLLYEGKGWAYFKLSDPSCKENFQKAIALGNNEFWGLGWCHNKLGEYEKAIIAFNTAEDIGESASSTISNGKGYAYYKLGEYDNAIDSFERAMDSPLLRYRIEAYDGLIQIYTEKKDSRKVRYYLKERQNALSQ
ncbi:MAG: tetratricopeptide repeat protein [Candidatus Woesearchaeota archaeon]